MPVGAHGPECSWGGGTALGSHDKGRPGLGVWWDTEKATLLTPCCCVVSDRKGPHQRGAGVFRRTEDQAQRQGGAPICCHVQPSHTCAQAAACLGGSGWGGALGGSGPLLRGFWGEGVCLSLEKNGVGPQLLPRQSPAKDRCGCVRTEPSAPVAVEGGKLALGGGVRFLQEGAAAGGSPQDSPKIYKPRPQVWTEGPTIVPTLPLLEPASRSSSALRPPTQRVPHPGYAPRAWSGLAGPLLSHCMGAGVGSVAV